jgi:hypothetical protein
MSLRRLTSAPESAKLNLPQIEFLDVRFGADVKKCKAHRKVIESYRNR